MLLVPMVVTWRWIDRPVASVALAISMALRPSFGLLFDLASASSAMASRTMDCGRRNRRGSVDAANHGPAVIPRLHTRAWQPWIARRRWLGKPRLRPIAARRWCEHGRRGLRQTRLSRGRRGRDDVEPATRSRSELHGHIDGFDVSSASAVGPLSHAAGHPRGVHGQPLAASRHPPAATVVAPDDRGLQRCDRNGVAVLRPRSARHRRPSG